MFKTLDLYCFSPTGGTRKAAEILAASIGEQINYIDLGRDGSPAGRAEAAVFAAPVFAGRIPDYVIGKLKAIKGEGKKAVTAVVYGVRAYEDALLELNDAVREAGFEILGSAALIARHSMLPEVGAGRPDEGDAAEIAAFGKSLVEKAERGECGEVTVPGNRPYRAPGVFDYSPVCTAECSLCGACIAVCPVGAIDMEDGGIVTDVDSCFMCLACTAACPHGARVVPTERMEMISKMLGKLKGVRRENEFFL